MKTFRCQCGNALYFENTQCLGCGKAVGFLPDRQLMSALEPEGDNNWRALLPGNSEARYRMCRNYHVEQVCNWMVPSANPQAYCRSCRLNQIIPNLSDPNNRLLWYRIERAKRRLLYTLLELGLPIVGRDEDSAHGLAFEFLQDSDASSEFDDVFSVTSHVMTGHRGGTITINIAEADPAARENMREKMNEGYRTLLGHFRHEIGHYYWERLVLSTPWLDQARNLFGDERADYSQALQTYYANGAPPDWEQHYISAYASSHPWEDWAESWAHYLHMLDTLETAQDVGFTIAGQRIVTPQELLLEDAQYAQDGYYRIANFDTLMHEWVQLTLAMNALNRSMGLRDAYPFVLSNAASEKLRFIHELIESSVNPDN